MDIDWSKAPEGATHHGRGDDCCYWAKYVGDQQYFINIARWDNGKWKEVTERYDESLLTARPNTEWTGSGLPPVGTVCEYQNSLGSWFRVEITAIAKKGICFIQIDRDGENYACQVSSKFRPIRTPEQIAAEKRSSAVTDMINACCNASALAYAVCGALYDAGYRKFEIVEE